MKRFFTIAAFFWACTFTQQAQHIDSSGDMKNEWSQHMLASGQKNDSLGINPAFTPNSRTMTKQPFHTEEIEK